jgi:hypothetical protein
MEVMFHFIFQLFKISILSCIYATLILITFLVIGHLKPNSLFKRVSINKFRLWFISGFFTSVTLFFFMFTYFGNHDLGDSAIVPIGHFKTVNQINGDATYVQKSDGSQLGIKNFTFDSDNLYAETQPEFNAGSNKYVIWNLHTDKWTFLKTDEEYLEAAKRNNYPLPDTFEEFWNFYKRHWSGWRFWVLP